MDNEIHEQRKEGVDLLSRRMKKQEIIAPRPSRVLFEFTSEDEDYVNMMLKKTAKQTLRKHRKEYVPSKENIPTLDHELDELLTAVEKKAGILPSSVEPIRNCRKCYFSTSFRIVGTDWYCQCTNVARTSGKIGWIWVHCESNLSCWRKPENQKSDGSG